MADIAPTTRLRRPTPGAVRRLWDRHRTIGTSNDERQGGKSMKRLFHSTLMAVFLASLSPGAFGQAEKPGDAAPIRTSPEQTALAPYLLAAEDAIAINVINFPNLSTQTEIPPDGKITVPL